MTSGLVNASFSFPEGQAVKMIFFAPCKGSQFSSIANTLQGFEFVFQCRSVALLWYLSSVFFLYYIWSQHSVLTFSFGDVLVDKRNADC